LRKIKVLDLFCGVGGWSVPFVEDGDEVYGVDIVDYGEYPGKLIVADVRDISGKDFYGFDLIIGSPPCEEFSIAKEMWKGTDKERNVEKGLELIYEFERIVEEAKPKVWVMENVKYLWDRGWYKRPPKVIFKISKKGFRCLWSNIDFPLMPVFLEVERRDIWRSFGWGKRIYRAKIPYCIARFVADYVKDYLRRLND
jgi:site-specific DNA-cytosine methylase